MSRYEFAGTEPDTRVSIGWDRPLATFFVHVMRTLPDGDDASASDADQDSTILWLGTHPRELPYAADAIRIARQHAVLPQDIGGTLEVDRLRTAGDSDGQAQQAMRPLIDPGD